MSQDVKALIGSIGQFRGTKVLSPEDRVQLLQHSKSLARELEPPADKVLEDTFSIWPRLAVRALIELNAFPILVNHNNPMSAQQLAEATGCGSALLVRLMRAATGLNYATETDIETYQANGVTRTVSSPPLNAGMRFVYDNLAAPNSLASSFIAWLKANDWKAPDSALDTPLQMAHDIKGLNAWDHWAKDPETIKTFNTFMVGGKAARAHWTSWYPVRERLLEGADADGTLMVDIAGGKGHDVDAFMKACPEVADSKLVLQDLQHVVDDTVGLDGRVQRVAYDFYTPQPVLGARIYFMHWIIHDWSDKDALPILRNVAQAMKPGYSKLLINDMVIPDRDAPLLLTGLDLTMMVHHAALERTEKQWRQLLPKAGLTVSKIWTYPGTEGIIEAIVE